MVICHKELYKIKIYINELKKYEQIYKFINQNDEIMSKPVATVASRNSLRICVFATK